MKLAECGTDKEYCFICLQKGSHSLHYTKGHSIQSHSQHCKKHGPRWKLYNKICAKTIREIPDWETRCVRSEKTINGVCHTMWELSKSDLEALKAKAETIDREVAEKWKDNDENEELCGKVGAPARSGSVTPSRSRLVTPLRSRSATPSRSRSATPYRFRPSPSPIVSPGGATHCPNVATLLEAQAMVDLDLITQAEFEKKKKEVLKRM